MIEQTIQELTAAVRELTAAIGNRPTESQAPDAPQQAPAAPATESQAPEAPAAPQQAPAAPQAPAPAATTPPAPKPMPTADQANKALIAKYQELTTAGKPAETVLAKIKSIIGSDKITEVPQAQWEGILAKVNALGVDDV